jgi:hypothetical protein
LGASIVNISNDPETAIGLQLDALSMVGKRKAGETDAAFRERIMEVYRGAPVPNVEGLTLGQANAAVTAAGLTPDPDPLIRRWAGYVELVAHIRHLRGKTLFLHAGQVGRIEMPGEQPWGYVASAIVVVTKAALLRYLQLAFGDYRDTVKIHVTESNLCLFVGASSHTW